MFLKLENRQITGSFKDRGAANRMAHLTADQRARGVNFGQIASYIAMIGLAEIRADPQVADAPTILHLFSRAENERPAGLSTWDEAFLKALYRTEHTDKQQLAEIKTTMVQEIAP